MGILDSITGSVGDMLTGGISGLFGMAGASDANSAAAANFQQQMNFEQGMRATQYQTAVGDLKAAGLNPMLALIHGGAGVPPAPSAPAYVSPVGAGVTSGARGFEVANEARKRSQEIENLKQSQTIKGPVEKLAETASNAVADIPAAAKSVGESAAKAVLSVEKVLDSAKASAAAAASSIPSGDSAVDIVRASPDSVLGKAQSAASGIVNSAVDFADRFRGAKARADSVSQESASSRRAQAEKAAKATGSFSGPWQKVEAEVLRAGKANPADAEGLMQAYRSWRKREYGF